MMGDKMEAYLSDGQLVLVVEKLKNGKYLVENIYEDDYDNKTWADGDPYVVSKIYDQPPRKVYAEDIQNALDMLKQYEVDIKDIKTQKREIVSELKDLKKEMENYGGLDLALAKLKGDYKYYVHKHAVCEIRNHSYQGDSIEVVLKAIGWGKTKLEVCTRLKIGSSSYGLAEVSLFKDKESAEEHARKIFIEWLDSMIKEDSMISGYTIQEKVFDRAKELGIKVPKRWLNFRKKRRIKSCEEAIREYKGSLEVKKEEIEDIKSGKK